MGYADRICPSHDCICMHLHKQQPDGSIPDQHEFQQRNPDQFLFIHHHVIPHLKELGTDDATIHTLFVENSRRFLFGH